jgi:predicted DNA-binding ribbon-helix-helix protein
MTSDMRSAVAKRSVVISGHKTSVSLEDSFWNEVQAIAKSRRITVSHLLHHIDHDRQNANLSSAIRVYVLQHLREQASAQQQPSQSQQSQPQNGQWPNQNQMRAN